MGKAVSIEHFVLDGRRWHSCPGGENTPIKDESGLGEEAPQGTY